MFVQNANVAQQIDVAAPVGLVFRIAGSFLTAPAIPDVNVPDPLDYGRDGFDGILVRAVDMAGVHVDAESRAGDGLHDPQGGGRVVHGVAHMGLDAEDYAVVLRPVRQASQCLDGLLQALLVVGFAARAAVDDGHANLGGGLHGLLHHGRILTRLLHRQQGQFIGPGQVADVLGLVLPSIQVQVVGHRGNGGQFNAVVAGTPGVLEGGLQVVAPKEDRIDAKLHVGSLGESLDLEAD